MSTYEEIRSRAQLFKAGHIVPRRILKCTRRKAQHLLRFWSDTYAIPVPGGYLLFTEKCADFYIEMRRSYGRFNENWRFKGAPYHAGRPGNRGATWFMPYGGESTESFQKRVLDYFKPSQIRWIDNSEYCPNE